MSASDSICESEEKPEVWRPVVGYEGRYEVSNFGRVKSIAGRFKTHLILKPRIDRRGYSIVFIGYGNTKRIHRLVLEAFVGECPEGMECAHANGVRTDNRLENLRWATHKENSHDRLLHGTHPRGDSHVSSRLSAEKVVAMRHDYASGKFTHDQMAAKYGVSSTTARYAISRRSWKHVE